MDWLLLLLLVPFAVVYLIICAIVIWSSRPRNYYDPWRHTRPKSRRRLGR